MARALAALALLALLSGCASAPETAPSPAAAPPSEAPPAAAAEAAPAAPAEPEVLQEEDLAWAVSGPSCADFADAYGETFRPELEGVTYDAAAVDPATIGRPWAVAFSGVDTVVGYEVAFWADAVGPGGRIVLMQVTIPPLGMSSTVEGDEVPAEAEFVTAAACGADGGAAHYAAGALQMLALL